MSSAFFPITSLFKSYVGLDHGRFHQVRTTAPPRLGRRAAAGACTLIRNVCDGHPTPNPDENQSCEVNPLGMLNSGVSPGTFTGAGTEVSLDLIPAR